MNRLRIKFEGMNPDNKYKHEGQFMIDTDESPKDIIARVQKALEKENAKAVKRFNDELHSRFDMVRNIIRDTDNDKLDLSCIGKDISTEEFFANEMEMEMDR